MGDEPYLPKVRQGRKTTAQPEWRRCNRRTSGMLFNSPIYLFLFLPAVFTVYFGLNKYRRYRTSRFFLLGSSLYFYSFWNVIHLLRIVFLSMFFNYWVGAVLSKKEGWFSNERHRKFLLYFGIAANLISLAYFKYMDFFIENINLLFSSHFPLLHIVLPLGISFFTFQEIAYLVDSYRGKTRGYGFVDYALFVTFFPQLIAGPIVHHKEMMEQFEKEENYHLNYQNIAFGFFFLVLGLFKKVVIADTFALWATNGFDHYQGAFDFFDAWTVSLSYTFQLYFDFSGYSDMAMGAARLFNIRLPINFNSPYKAMDIQDFWKRWHMTLGRFMRDYMYIPLGGNRVNWLRTVLNLFIVFLLGGIWHGAGWTFVIWGLLHGGAMVIFRAWQKWGIALPKVAAWFITFNFINAGWIFFRADTVSDAFRVFTGMAGLNGIKLPLRAQPLLDGLKYIGIEFSKETFAASQADPFNLVGWLLAVSVIAVFFKNSHELALKFNTNPYYLVALVLLFVVSFYSMSNYSEFIYFRF